MNVDEFRVDVITVVWRHSIVHVSLVKYLEVRTNSALMHDGNNESIPSGSCGLYCTRRTMLDKALLTLCIPLAEKM